MKYKIISKNDIQKKQEGEKEMKVYGKGEKTIYKH